MWVSVPGFASFFSACPQDSLFLLLLVLCERTGKSFGNFLPSSSSCFLTDTITTHYCCCCCCCCSKRNKSYETRWRVVVVQDEYLSESAFMMSVCPRHTWKKKRSLLAALQNITTTHSFTLSYFPYLYKQASFQRVCVSLSLSRF